MEKSVAEREQKISEQIQVWTPEEIAIIKSTVAKGLSDLELAYFLNVAKTMKLNPFTKEIWCYKDLKNNIVIFAGRDGFLAKAQQDPRWNGIASSAVRDGETFTMDVANGEISHKKDIKSKANILGAYAICRPKGCQITTIEWADFDTYNKGHNVWKADPEAMIKKVAEVHALKKAYGISGLQAEEDYKINGETAVTLDHEEKVTNVSILRALEMVNNCTGDEDYKQIIEAKLNAPELTNMEFENIITELRMNQPRKF